MDNPQTSGFGSKYNLSKIDVFHFNLKKHRIRAREKGMHMVKVFKLLAALMRCDGCLLQQFERLAACLLNSTVIVYILSLKGCPIVSSVPSPQGSTPNASSNVPDAQRNNFMKQQPLVLFQILGFIGN